MYTDFLKFWLNEPNPRTVEQKLLQVVRHAYKNVTWYQDLLREHGVSLGDINSLKNFEEKFPITDSTTFKRAMREDENRVLDPKMMPMLGEVDQSSGSTGYPTKIYRSHREVAHNRGKTIYHLVSGGLKPWDKTVRLCPVVLNVEGRDSLLQKFGFFYRKTIDHFTPTDEVIDFLIQHKINAIYGRKAAIQLVAEKIIQRNDIPAFNLVMTGSEVIDDASRRLLKSAFRPKHYGEYYGCVEVGILADRKNKEDYQINYNSVWLSVEDPVEISEGVYRGNLLITSLFSYLQPLIKYRIGDIVCVRNPDKILELGMTISEIEGRQDDFIFLPNGGKITGAMLKCSVETIPGVWRYRVIQEEPGSCNVQVMMDNHSKQDKEEVILNLEKLLKGKIDYNLEFTDQIHPEKTGKFKVIINKIQHP